MMDNPALNFEGDSKLGVVAAVDSSRVVIDVTDSELLTRTSIGQLIAVRGSTQQDYLIAMTERVSRSLSDGFPQNLETHEEVIPLVSSPTDTLRAFVIGTYRTVDGINKNTFKRGADVFPQIDRECYVIEGSNLQSFMGILGADIPDDQKLNLGKFATDSSADAIASGDKFFQRHAAILGSTGSGKSWAVALVLEKAARLKHPNIIVFDMHGEYAALCDKTNGGFAQSLKVAGPGDLDSPTDETLFLPYWLLNRDEMLSMILDRSDQNAPNQASRFTMHVKELKSATLKAEGKTDVEKTFTVDSPIPYKIGDLVTKLSIDNTAKGVGTTGKPIKGPWEDKLTRFLSRLEAKLDDRRYGFMFKPPAVALNYNWLTAQLLKLLSNDNNNGIKVVDFSEVPSDVLPVVTGTLARLLYDIQFWMADTKRTPVCLLCDEAHLYLPVKENADSVQKQALHSFERIAKEGRKYGFSLLAVSQRPSDISKTILSQCNNFLALRLTNERDQGVIKRLVPDSLAGLTEMLPLLDVGEAIMLGDAVLLPSRIKLDKPVVQPDSATRDFWREWDTMSSDNAAINSAVEALRSQTRT